MEASYCVFIRLARSASTRVASGFYIFPKSRLYPYNLNERNSLSHRLITGCEVREVYTKGNEPGKDGNVQPGSSQFEEALSGNMVETPTPTAGVVLLYNNEHDCYNTGTTPYTSARIWRVKWSHRQP